MLELYQESSCHDAVEVDNWIGDMELYFKMSKMKEDQKMEFAAMLFGPKAKTWWRILQANVSSDTPEGWNELKEVVKSAFKPAGSYQGARNQFAALRQDGSVATYVDKFCELQLVIGDVSEAEALEKFVRGLKTEVQSHVRTFLPKDVETAQNQALVFDDTTGLADTIPKWIRKDDAVPMELDYAEMDRKKNAARKNSRAKQCFVCEEDGQYTRYCSFVDKAKALNGEAQSV
jgi:hypothetical protein